MVASTIFVSSSCIVCTKSGLLSLSEDDLSAYNQCIPMVYRFIFACVPFLAFFGGYVLSKISTAPSLCVAPTLVGKKVYDAFRETESSGLALSLLATSVDQTCDPGTVLYQSPEPGKKIKQNQIISLVITTRPQALSAADYRLSPCAVVKSHMQLHDITVREYHVPLLYSADTCIAQVPAPGQSLEKKTIDLYVVAQDDSFVLVPSLRNYTVGDVQEFLALHNCYATFYDIYGNIVGHPSPIAQIATQKPCAGTIIRKSSLHKNRFEIQMGE